MYVTLLRGTHTVTEHNNACEVQCAVYGVTVKVWLNRRSRDVSEAKDECNHAWLIQRVSADMKHSVSHLNIPNSHTGLQQAHSLLQSRMLCLQRCQNLKLGSHSGCRFRKAQTK